MNIKVSKAECQERLMDVRPVLERKSTMPVLSHCLLQATQEGVLLTATDLETAIRRPLEARVEAPGSLCVPALKLLEIVRELEEGELELRSEDGQWLRLSAGRSSFRLACLPAEDYPQWPSLGQTEELSLEAPVLEQMLERTVYAAGEADTRYTLNGILFHVRPSEGLLTLVGTDGHRMAVASSALKDGLSEERKLIVQRKAASELRKFLAQAEEVLLQISKNHVLFKLKEVQFLTRLIEGTYPNYAQVIPASNPLVVVAQREALIRALRRVSALSRERTGGVKLELQEGLLRLETTNPDLGEAHDELEVHYSGEPLGIGFNARYLLDALGAMQSERVVLRLQDALSPALLEPEGQEGYLCVVMPMRI
jgi:DNA polymerase-3 subunit beta